ncbi:hypothetical protein CAEBREN_11100 [Caenorhabditis brenneri]|uniref:NTF2-like domain-containing protein n=1 Tax=Caenorhabditis brenneri TaxID=135651 RepID=G0MH70_CAEBE|nr:hypothetical protein CAEBREN_11100 [Caenorhabditis brenneri]
MRVVFLLLLLVSSSVEDNADGVEKLLKKMASAIHTRDDIKIGELIDEKFYYKTCNGTVNKDGAVAYLKSFPYSEDVSFNLIPGSLSSSHVHVRRPLTKFAVSSNINQLNLSGSFFYMGNLEGQLVYGFDRECGRIDFVGKSDGKLLELSSEEMKNKVEEFLQVVERAVATKNKFAISKLFRNDFILHTCRMRINAERMTGSTASDRDFPHFNIVSVEDVISSIRTVVSRSDFQYEYYLNKKHNQLEMGVILGCPKEESNSTFTRPDSLIKRLENDIATRDVNRMKNHFSPDFEYLTCSTQYNLSEFLEGIAAIDSNTSITLVIEQMEQGASLKKILVTVQGLQMNQSLKMIMYFSKIKQTSGQIISARVKTCSSSMKFVPATKIEDNFKSF